MRSQGELLGDLKAISIAKGSRGDLLLSLSALQERSRRLQCVELFAPLSEQPLHRLQKDG